MSVLENFKNIPRSPMGGRQGSNVIFFSLNLQRRPWRKKKEGGLSPPQRATGLFFSQGPHCEFEKKIYT